MDFASAPILGIDVSKDRIDAHLLPEGRSWCVATGPGELETWIAGLPEGIALAVLEASGGIEATVASLLAHAGIPVAIVNPKQVRSFAFAMGQRAKTDPIDARLIALFGARVQPRPRPLPEEDQALLKELVTRRQQLVAMRVAEQNRRHTARTKAVRQSIDAVIRSLNKQLEGIDEDLDTLIRQSPLWQAQEDLLASVPGVGPKTARTILATLPEIGTMDRRQVAALAGLAPYARESGRWKGKRFIGGGRPAVRTTLYMSALTAIRHNPPLRAFYRNLVAQGKPKKLALTACMRKLLTILNAMVRDNQPWSDRSVEA